MRVAEVVVVVTVAVVAMVVVLVVMVVCSRSRVGVVGMSMDGLVVFGRMVLLEL